MADPGPDPPGGGSGGNATPRAPAISLPKGGGAIRGIGEKFSVNAVNGTASLSIPLPTSHSRGAFTPELHLSYDSGAGNGPFGMGWTIDIPSISRRTDKGLPLYRDEVESDIFVLAGAEDLVPLLDAAQARVRIDRTVKSIDYSIYPYLPRIEGIYARIERWVDKATGQSHWRTISNDNVTTIFGDSSESRVADPDDPRKIFTYFASRRFDGLGNLTTFLYSLEGPDGVDLGATHEINRDSAARISQRYPKSVRYGFSTPYQEDYSTGGAPAALPAQYYFELVFDYGEHDTANPKPGDALTRPERPDPFSSYRAGFEVRTYRRCRRALMFHHFPAEAGVGDDCLVRALELQYLDELAVPDPDAPLYSLLVAAFHSSFRRSGAAYDRKALPPIEFSYGKPRIDPSVRTLTRSAIEELPAGIDSAKFQLIDLDGEGMPGMLSDESDIWIYRRNISPLTAVPQSDGSRAREVADFEPPHVVTPQPTTTDLKKVRLADICGDGSLDAISLSPDLPGFWARGPDQEWEPFREFQSLALGLSQGDVQFVDLTGDGRADILIAGDNIWIMHPSLGPDGFGEAIWIDAPWSDEDGPRPVASSPTEAIHMADMTGDGLADVVRIRENETCYFPNLGYGRFGRKVTLEGSPRFAAQGEFNARRVLLADIDGSGTADILYVGSDGVSVWFNRSGNSWSDPQRIAVFPSASDISRVQTADLLGNGTSCLVWTSPLPADAETPLKYIDLMSGRKPHLLTATRNNLGGETRLTYAPSTRFYLEDRRAGRPWITQLPFPVQLVERVEVFDWITKTRFATRYTYHHGHYAGDEREFRGFGMVETWDTETHGSESGFPDGENWDESSWNPPIHTKSWFHTGVFVEWGAVSKQFAGEYWTEPALRPPSRTADRRAMRLSDSIIPAGVPAAAAREACRALKGQLLRRETYADDVSPKAELPYEVTEHNYEVRQVQPIGPNRCGVFSSHQRETLTFHYERNEDDPRVAHDAVLDVDAFGHPLKSVSVLYPRRPGAPEPEPGLSAPFRSRLANDQNRLHIMASRTDFTNAVLLADDHREPQPCETVRYEITGAKPAGNRPGITNLFTFAELDALWTLVSDGAHDLPFEEIYQADITGVPSPSPLPQPMRRRVENLRTYYRADDLSTELPLGTVESLAIAGTDYHAAFSPGILARVLNGLIGAPELNEGGYRQLPGCPDWWIPSEVIRFSPGDGDTPAAELAFARANFFLVRRSIDPFGGVNRTSFDTYKLLPVSASDPAGNTHSAENDYRLLEAWRVTDPNNNRVEVAFDILGLVTGSAIRGKTGDGLGDNLTGFVADLSDAVIAAQMTDPLADPLSVLQGASSRFIYDIEAYSRTAAAPQPEPSCSLLISRETHVSDLAPGDTTRCRVELVYSDGSGHQVQHKTQAEPGPLVDGGPSVSPRWVGTGWVIRDNKGHPIQEYEPFFSSTPAFEFAPITGVSHRYFYDPQGRNIGVLHPDDTWSKTVFDAWRVEHWEQTDTVLVSDPRADPDLGDHFTRLLNGGAFVSWHDKRVGGNFGADAKDKAAEQDAALKTEAFSNTPGIEHFDTGGQVSLSITDYGVGGRQPIWTAHDCEGEQLATVDALDRSVVEYAARETSGGSVTFLSGRDLSGRELFQNHMDSGVRRMLLDIVGHPIRSWDARGFRHRTLFDALRRVTHRYASQGAGPERLIARTVYGEGLPQINACSEILRHYDQAGLIQHVRYDFKSNLTHRARRLALEYRDDVNWSPIANTNDPAQLDLLGAPLLHPNDLFEARIFYDALNRPIQAVSPHSASMKPNVIRAEFNEGGKVERVNFWEQVTAPPTTLLDPATADIQPITNIDYDAHGERVLIAHANGTVTRRTIDPLTKRLRRIVTTRPNSFPANQRVVQDLRYTFDPAGNVTRARDEADIQNVVFFRNQRIEPSTDYTYDAGSRLLRASGREHLGQTGGGGLAPPMQPGDTDAPRTGLAHPGDGNQMGTYVETYELDPVSNLLSVFHLGGSGQWRRRYSYVEPSRIDPVERGNRLSRTSIPSDAALGPYSDAYTYDAHGNTTTMPHLSAIEWNDRDLMRSSVRQVVTSGSGEKTHYRYDATDHRLRKVTDRASAGGVGTRRAERIYLGALEIYREYAADGQTITLERESLLVIAERKTSAILERRTNGADPAPARSLKYQHSTLNGSASLELDEAARVISYEEYYPYGGTSYQAVASQTETSKRLRFQGLERDTENGFYYAGARYFAPWLGRWISPDPEGLADGPNGYAYARANPIIIVDPTGTIGVILGGLTIYELAMIGAFATAATAVVVTNAQRHPIPMPRWHPFSSGEDDFADPPTMPPLPFPIPRPPPAPPTPAPAPPAPAPAPAPAPTPAPAPPVPVPAPPVPVPVPPAPVPVPIPVPIPAPVPIPIPIPRPTPVPIPIPHPPPVSGPRPTPRTRPRPVPDPAPRPMPRPRGPGRQPIPEPDQRRRRRGPLRYVTYRKYNRRTGKVYVGRTMGYGDPRAIVAARDLNHHMTARGYGPARLDRYADATRPFTSRRDDPAYRAIRGREQQLIDYYGGARSDPDRRPNSRSGNAIRGVAKDNWRGPLYHQAASRRFGQVAPYTGY